MPGNEHADGTLTTQRGCRDAVSPASSQGFTHVRFDVHATLHDCDRRCCDTRPVAARPWYTNGWKEEDYPSRETYNKALFYAVSDHWGSARVFADIPRVKRVFPLMMLQYNSTDEATDTICACLMAIIKPLFIASVAGANLKHAFSSPYREATMRRIQRHMQESSD